VAVSAHTNKHTLAKWGGTYQCVMQVGSGRQQSLC